MAALAFACIPTLSAPKADYTVTANAASYFTTTPTGYTKAEDVQYVTAGGYTVNWGARGEDCTFLSSKALSFYTTANCYETFSKLGGGSSQSNAHQSSLYSALQSFMKSKHTHINGYNANNTYLQYTDCVSNGYNNYISSFYSGRQIGPKWDSAKTWNKEHTWPNSKGMEGSDEDDVMMIRPTSVQENSSRGNTAYGQSSGYFDPNCEGANLRGDCARIVLYVYTRWGNTSKMWGSNGVMESMNVLLQWMQEDPVDTWEMGRNDAVQSITGTRNVFVDYPELAWQLFGKAAPSGMNTPSGIANGGEIVPPVVDPNLPETPDTPVVDLPAANSTVSIADALAIGGAMTHNTTTTNKYYLTGKVADISNTEYGNMNIQDDSGNKIYIYGTYNADGSTRFDAMSNQPKVGDTITVYSVIGNYNGAQLKNAWITSINGSGGSTAPDTPTTPDTPVTPPSGGDTTAGNAVATFDLGENGSAAHNDGTSAASKSFTNNGYTLNITDGVNAYFGARDTKGNSCIKLGVGKTVGSLQFTVPSDVVSVTLEIAKYKANASSITINGKTYTLNGSSDNGEYDTITVDTSATKTISLSTNSDGKRIMINTIAFIGAATPDDSTPDTPVPDDSTPDDSTPGTSVPGDSTPDDSTPNSDPDVSTPTLSDLENAAAGCSGSIGVCSAGIVLMGSLLLIRKKKENN